MGVLCFVGTSRIGRAVQDVHLAMAPVTLVTVMLNLLADALTRNSEPSACHHLLLVASPIER